ncbi:anti-sigma F factor [Candidatus Allofournierella merdipullorum]|uniref:anti-sigma F factor n=1 Tax=Candidatus Allofournierella merdipullorum TaxID=2838595 RepID=UPI002A8A5C17|nr:anti-sigma F factor [Candidatus Fournierella merdipullorum]
MKAKNLVKLSFYSRSVNEGFARGALAAFLAQADPTVPELADIKTAVSEAVTNCIVHAYPGGVGLVHMSVALYEGGKVKITIADKGVGIADVEKAMQPMFTTGNPEERAGLGFAVMQSFMDKVKVNSKPGQGTRVVMTKTLAGRG